MDVASSTNLSLIKKHLNGDGRVQCNKLGQTVFGVRSLSIGILLTLLVLASIAKFSPNMDSERIQLLVPFYSSKRYFISFGRFCSSNFPFPFTYNGLNKQYSGENMQLCFALAKINLSLAYTSVTMSYYQECPKTSTESSRREFLQPAIVPWGNGFRFVLCYTPCIVVIV